MKKSKKKIIYIFSIIIIALIILALIPNKSYPDVTREEKIPSDIQKVTTATDKHIPVMLSNEYEKPVPLSSVINTAGAEDSPFITPDGNTLYFFFTPDVRIPAEKQLLDEVTGIWISQKKNNVWAEPERIWLQKPGKLSLDGCEFIQDNIMLFCSAREGYTGVQWFSAENKIGTWTNWKEVNFPKDYQVGELHQYENDLYFHSSKEGGKGKLDIWVMKKNSDGTWAKPTNLEIINSGNDEGWPAISPDGQELFFTRTYLGTPAIYKSKKVNGEWNQPKLIISQFAGEPTIDNQGNIYFVHHFYSDDEMIEADIYFAKKK